MKTSLFAFVGMAMFAIPISLNAQHAIKGTVQNESGEPLTGAQVGLENYYSGTHTDKNGDYLLNNLQNGTYILRARFLGYEEFRDTVKIDGYSKTVKIQLVPTSFMTGDVIIEATRANERTPTTYNEITKKDLDKSNFGQDLPYLLDETPSTVVTSDAGAGIGYTGVRIRGTDPTRTNVTVNGIPMNDAESHGVFWVNMPDFASSVDNMQIQRGVGTSTNGAAAFGASINIQTNELNKEAYAELDNAYGSFNTWRHTIKAGTGLINNKFSLDARLSKISSDGYIDRASSDLKSFYVSGAWHGKKSNLRFNIFSGKEVTYQAWNGVFQDDLNDNRRMNSAGAYIDENGVQRYYDNEVDNYQQDHYQLHFSHRFSNKLNLNVSGHYTRGRGFYEQFRRNDRFSTYGFNPVVVDGDTITRTDLIRRRWLDNHFYGAVYSLNYNNQKGLNVVWGGGANQYIGDHFGEVIWARFASQSDIRDRYYDNQAVKSEANSYLKATYQWKKLVLFGDIQYRFIDFRFEGNAVVNEIMTVTDQVVNYHFINPKAGLMYDFNEKHNLYLSYGMSNREPVRRDFTESTPDSRPNPEQLHNVEFGYRMRYKKFMLNVNDYFMYYKDQLVLTGQINDVGGYTRSNVDKSYRVGTEIELGYKPIKYLHFTANAAFSVNKIIEFNEYIDNYDDWSQEVIEHRNTDIAFSPNVIAGARISLLPVDDLEISFINKYVGRQFLDNTSNPDRQIDAYFVTNFRVNYTLRNVFFKEMTFGLMVNNIFNNLFENNGYTFSYIAGGERMTENYYYPQAGTHFLFHIRLRL